MIGNQVNFSLSISVTKSDISRGITIHKDPAEPAITLYEVVIPRELTDSSALRKMIIRTIGEVVMDEIDSRTRGGERK